MATVIIDGQEIEIDDAQRLNGIQAARLAGVDIPHYCWHPGLSVVASCRMCLVETGRRDPDSGDVSMVPKLVPACQTPAADQTVFVTNSDKVKAARAMVEEDLLIRHPIDCPICDKAGECSLQDYHFEHGQAERRADLRPFTSRRRTLGDTVTLFVDRCVMCSRCVRFCREVSGSAELMIVNRGSHEEIDVFPGFPLANKMSGNVVDLCPVGALGDRDFLYQQRVWFMKKHPHVCAGCSTGCSIDVEENQDHIYRLKPRENAQVNKWWICDEGRYSYHHVHSPERITSATRCSDAERVDLQWSEVPSEVDGRLRAAGRVVGLLSPFLTVEEAWLMGRYLRQVDPDALLVLGPVPTRGEDETYAEGFTIHAEKAPNRRGVSAVIKGLTGKLTDTQELLEQLPDIKPGAVWVSGGYPDPKWVTPELVDALAQIPLRIVQDIFPTPLSQQATYELGGLAFAERGGSYVNFRDHLQSFSWAVRPPAGAFAEGQLFWQLLGRSGLYQSASLLPRIAAEIAYFAAAGHAVPSTGVDLNVNKLAHETTEVQV